MSPTGTPQRGGTIADKIAAFRGADSSPSSRCVKGAGEAYSLSAAASMCLGVEVEASGVMGAMGMESCDGDCHACGSEWPPTWVPCRAGPPPTRRQAAT
jgi:hypothetical protein